MRNSAHSRDESKTNVEDCKYSSQNIFIHAIIILVLIIQIIKIK